MCEVGHLMGFKQRSICYYLSKKEEKKDIWKKILINLGFWETVHLPLP